MADYKKILGFLKVDSIVEDLMAIVEAKLELFKIELKEKAARAITKLISAIVLGLLVFLIVIFFSISVAAILNHFLESKFWGYVIVTGFYLFVLIGFRVFHVGDKIENKIESALNNFDEDPTEDKNE